MIRRLVLLAVAILSACDDAPPPAAAPAPVAPPAPEPAAEPPPPPAPPREAIAPGSDEPPAVPATREDSERHAPRWADDDDELPPNERALLFELAGATPTTAGALTGAVIVCQISATVRPDNPGLFDLPDLRANLKVGKNPKLEQSGPEDSSGMSLALRFASLAPGDTIRARVSDRDLFRDDPLGTVQGVYRGTLPWAVRKRQLAVECRALAGPALEQELGRRLAVCDAALTTAAADVRFDPAPIDFGFHLSGLHGGREAVRRAARLVGWGDPRIVRRLEWLGRIERTFFGAVEAHIAEVMKSAAPAGTPVRLTATLEARVLGLACAPAPRRPPAQPGGCLVRLELRTTDGSGVPFAALTFPRLVLRDGEVVQLRSGGGGDDDGDDATETAILEPFGRFTPDPARPPVLLVTAVDITEPPVYLRLP